MKIKDLCESERPREKLLARGAQALSDGELLAILLRNGSRTESALELAARLLNLTDGRLTGLFECDSGYLASLSGVGTAKAAALLSAFELGRRFIAEQRSAGARITRAGAVFDLMQPRLKGLRHEECWELLLDGKGVLLKVMRLTVGGSKVTVIDIPAIIRNAISHAASGIIIVHNHPNGDPRPSNADIRETSALRDACTSCSLLLLDHVIIADEHFFSFNEEKMY